MILDEIGNSRRYAELGERFARAFGFLWSADLDNLPEGRHEIDGDRVFAILSDGPGRRRAGAPLEIHERYADIQLVISGIEEMGWRPASRCGRPTVPYDPERDIAFFSDEPDAWFTVHPGCFAVFFPEDAHLPLVSDGNVRKVVVKVLVGST